MKTILFMAVSADGYVARKDGSEDFLPHEGWLQMLKYTKKYGNLIRGRKTYEAVKNLGGKFIDDIKDIPIILVSKDTKSSYPKNVTICSSPLEALNIVKKMGLKKAFLSGGPTLNTSFAQEGLLDEIILNYNTTILGDGIKLFGEGDFELNLKIKSIKNISSDIFQVHYFC